MVIRVNWRAVESRVEVHRRRTAFRPLQRLHLRLVGVGDGRSQRPGVVQQLAVEGGRGEPFIGDVLQKVDLPVDVVQLADEQNQREEGDRLFCKEKK